MKTIVGLFDERSEAQRVYDDLTKNGFSSSAISLLTSEASSSAAIQDLATSIPDPDIRFYQEGVRQGGALVVAHVDDGQAERAANIMARYNMVDVDARAANYRTSGSDVTLRDFGEGDQVLPVIEEELKVGKRTVESGRMRVYSRVTETPVEEQVRLREEHVSVDRRPVDRAVTDADLASAFKEQSFEVTSTAEEAVVSKTARVVEEVVIGKQANERTETVRDTVRRTDVNVEEVPSSTTVSDTTTTKTVSAHSATDVDTTRTLGATDVTASTAGRQGFESYDSDYRTYYNTNMTNSGYTYEQLSPVYRYGYDLANDERYSNRDWNTFESDARTSWEERNPGTWENFKDSVRYAWDKARAKI